MSSESQFQIKVKKAWLQLPCILTTLTVPNHLSFLGRVQAITYSACLLMGSIYCRIVARLYRQSDLLSFDITLFNIQDKDQIPWYLGRYSTKDDASTGCSCR